MSTLVAFIEMGMAEVKIPEAVRRRELAETSLAKNLVAVRTALGLTQDALSSASGISRATIAQLETGVSDPRLSTLSALANAMGMPTGLLLLSEVEVRSVIDLLGKGTEHHFPPLPPGDQRQLRQWLNGGMLRDRTEAVRLVARWVAASGGSPPMAAVVAGLCAVIVPDPGLLIGARWGTLIAAEMDRFDNVKSSQG
jgi:transcriptional regulator with XRE-family HTH domain